MLDFQTSFDHPFTWPKVLNMQNREIFHFSLGNLLLWVAKKNWSLLLSCILRLL